jgi:pentatricopeptide repeat protein
MSACERAGRWEKAVELLYEARNVIGLSDNAYLWTTAIRLDDLTPLFIHPYLSRLKTSACGQSGQWERALGLLDEMRAEIGLSPNVELSRVKNSTQSAQDSGSGSFDAAHNAAISACAQRGKWREALKVSRGSDFLTPGSFAFYSGQIRCSACSERMAWPPRFPTMRRWSRSTAQSAGVRRR